MQLVKKEDVLARVKSNPEYVRPTDRPERFKAGDKIMVANLSPSGHTRLPRYARGRIGTIQKCYGSFVYPDTVAHGKGELPQHLYSVRFDATELWGAGASPRHSVYLDLWDDYIAGAL